jgi:3-isopropylmalate/(R)-2-methylmalate dehydratase small subunit
MSLQVIQEGHVLKGKAWVFGDDINTDIIIPFRLKARTNDPVEMGQYCMYGIDPDFPKKISKGDFIVAGNNFGGGSSREQAPVSIKYAGIAAVVAESFSRIFTRNCFAIGLPILQVENITKAVNQNDNLEIDIDKLTVKNLSSNKTLQAREWPKFLTDILKSGGVVEYYKHNNKFPWE